MTYGMTHVGRDHSACLASERRSYGDRTRNHMADYDQPPVRDTCNLHMLYGRAPRPYPSIQRSWPHFAGRWPMLADLCHPVF